jgi:hypothetical protein
MFLSPIGLSDFMKKQFLSLFISMLFVFSISAQTKEARKIDEFSRLPCGDFMARMDGVFTTLKESPDSKIYVVYYGGLFRKITAGWDKKRKFYKIVYDKSHREDGLNWAKSIPLFLTTYAAYPTTPQNLLKDKIILIDGGFRENLEVEIWLVPKDAALPKPTPTIDEKDIDFRRDGAYKTPNYTKCY